MNKNFSIKRIRLIDEQSGDVLSLFKTELRNLKIDPTKLIIYEAYLDPVKLIIEANYGPRYDDPDYPIIGFEYNIKSGKTTIKYNELSEWKNLKIYK